MAGGWSLDKHIPVALILAMLVQTAAIVWWAATTSQRVTTLEDNLVATKADVKENDAIGSRVVRLETNIEDMKRSQDRMEAKVDRLLQQRSFSGGGGR